MADSIRDLFFGAVSSGRELVEAVEPRRSFDDVVLPGDHPARAQSRPGAGAEARPDLSASGAWPSGTRPGWASRSTSPARPAPERRSAPRRWPTRSTSGCSWCATPSWSLAGWGRPPSTWPPCSAPPRGRTRCSSSTRPTPSPAGASPRSSAAYEREANAVVNVLLHELESFPGVVIFATNLAANIDPAFERRIRTHILFEMPDVEERERIWAVQLHARKTPLADDVDFRALAEAYPAKRRRHQERGAQGGPDRHHGAGPRLARSGSTSATSFRAWPR